MESVYLETTFTSSARLKDSWGDELMWEDPIVSEVRRIRGELCERFDFDVAAIFADLRKRQAVLGKRLVPPPEQGAAQEPLEETARSAGGTP
jgi:hypothetical protein